MLDCRRRLRGVFTARYAWLLVIAAAIALTAPSSASAAPSVTVTGISSGSTVSGTVTLGASTSSNATQVKWYVDDVEVGWDGSSPWQLSWNSASVANGTHTLFAKAANSSGAWGTSSFVSFNVSNAVSSSVSVTSPSPGTTVSGTVTLSATASDPKGITQMKWYVDGKEVGWDGSSPWQISWSSASVANGAHSIFAKAANSAGTWLTSPSVSFNVQNGTTSSSKWQLVMSDNFDGTTVDTSKWGIYGPNWPGHNGVGLRDGRAVGVQNGALTITARMLDGKIVSGGLWNRLDQAYGRYEFDARTDNDPSGTMNGVVLTWPQSGNFPIDGEMDIYETLWNTSRYPFYSFIHYGADNRQYNYYHQADASQWHHMTMEWEPNAVRIYRDGALAVNLTDTNAIPDVPHHLCIQLDPFKQTLPAPVRIQVDNVRIYKRNA